MILKWVTTMFDLGHIFLDQLCPTHWATCSILKDFVQLYFVFTVISTLPTDTCPYFNNLKFDIFDTVQ